MKSKLTKLVSFILAVVMTAWVFPSIPLPVWAANKPVAQANGFIALIEPIPTDISESDIVRINNENILEVDWAQPGKYYVLEEDIYLEDEWEPVDNFAGSVFDGQGHSINNLFILGDRDRRYAGFFDQIRLKDVTIKNVGLNINSIAVSFESLYLASAGGGLVGYCTFSTITIENSYTTGNVYSSASIRNYIGGLVGYSDNSTITIENSYTTGDFSSSAAFYTYAGGLVGYGSGTLTIENSFATGNVSASSYAGGLVGSCYAALTIENSYAGGNVSIASYAGGLVGSCNGDFTMGYTITIENSYATGNVSGSSSAGGLVGSSSGSGSGETLTIENSYATGNVSGSSYAGGLIGSSSSIIITIEKSYATGTVSGSSSAGGLVGYCYTLTIENSYATGNVSSSSTSSDSYAGGLVGSGYALGTITIENSYATGTVSSSSPNSSYAGGLVGSGGKIMIMTSYAIGYISNTSGNKKGGLVGACVASLSSIAKSYYNFETTGVADNGYGIPKNTAEMLNKNTYANFDFDKIWGIIPTINGGYPHLQSLLESYNNNKDVTGKIKSYAPKTATTIRLLQSGVEKYKTTVTATAGTGQTTQNFALTGILPGTYKLEITKPGHLKYTKTTLVVTGENITLPEVTLIPGDLDGDGYVGYNDFLIFLANYNKSGAGIINQVADIDGDGYVGYNDFIAFLSGYGKANIVE